MPLRLKAGTRHAALAALIARLSACLLSRWRSHWFREAQKKMSALASQRKMPNFGRNWQPMPAQRKELEAMAFGEVKAKSFQFSKP